MEPLAWKAARQEAGHKPQATGHRRQPTLSCTLPVPVLVQIIVAHINRRMYVVTRIDWITYGNRMGLVLPRAKDKEEERERERGLRE